MTEHNYTQVTINGKVCNKTYLYKGAGKFVSVNWNDLVPGDIVMDIFPIFGPNNDLDFQFRFFKVTNKTTAFGVVTGLDVEL